MCVSVCVAALVWCVKAGPALQTSRSHIQGQARMAVVLCITEAQKAEGIQIHECRSCLCLWRNLYTEAKAPYHLGKPAEFTEIHDYRLIQLHPISLSFHLTVEHSEMRIGDRDKW